MIPFPCPKCGSIPAVYRKKGIAGPSNFYRERVACKCGMVTREHKAPGKAVATWNRRSSSLLSPDVAGLVARLRDRAEGYREGGPSSEHTAALLDEAATALSSERAAHEQTNLERNALKESIGGHISRGAQLSADAAAARKAASRNLVRAEIAEARIAELEKALTSLVELNDNHSPFGGELYQDRIDRTWDAARRSLGGKKNG